MNSIIDNQKDNSIGIIKEKEIKTIEHTKITFFGITLFEFKHTIEYIRDNGTEDL